MEWLILFLAIGFVVAAVVWLAGRALRRRPEATEENAAEDPLERSGPRHYDVAAGVDQGDGADPSP